MLHESSCPHSDCGCIVRYTKSNEELETLRLRTTECCKMANDKNKEEDVNTSIKKARTEDTASDEKPGKKSCSVQQGKCGEAIIAVGMGQLPQGKKEKEKPHKRL